MVDFRLRIKLRRPEEQKQGAKTRVQMINAEYCGLREAEFHFRGAKNIATLKPVHSARVKSETKPIYKSIDKSAPRLTSAFPNDRTTKGDGKALEIRSTTEETAERERSSSARAQKSRAETGLSTIPMFHSD